VLKKLVCFLKHANICGLIAFSVRVDYTKVSFLADLKIARLLGIRFSRQPSHAKGKKGPIGFDFSPNFTVGL
jgi:hypothetical protein